MSNPNPSPATRFRAGNPGGPGRPRRRPLGPRRRPGRPISRPEWARLRPRPTPWLAAEPTDADVDAWLRQAQTGDVRAIRALLRAIED